MLLSIFEMYFFKDFFLNVLLPWEKEKYHSYWKEPFSYKLIFWQIFSLNGFSIKKVWTHISTEIKLKASLSGKTNVHRETEEYKRNRNYDHWFKEAYCLRKIKTLSKMLFSYSQGFVDKE